METAVDNRVTTNDEDTFYSKAKDYWAQIPPTVDGVLGGLGIVSNPDIEGSERLLNCIFKLRSPPAKCRALDCGAGIGRITKELLVRYFDKVDLVEQNSTFLDKARQYVTPPERLGELYCCGLQEFKPGHKYDVIWCQWVLGHLKDSDFISFMKKCQGSLTSNGVIVVKENIASGDGIDFDSEDSSITRPLAIYTDLFEKSNLKVILVINQSNFPQGLYRVKMFALKPK